MEGRTKPLKSALDKILSLPTYGKTDEPSHPKVPWSKFKSYPRVEGRTNPLMGALIKKFKSYLWVEGWTKPLKSALDKILSFPTYERTDEPSHPKVPWSKFKSYVRVEGQTKPLMGALVKI